MRDKQFIDDDIFTDDSEEFVEAGIESKIVEPQKAIKEEVPKESEIVPRISESKVEAKKEILKEQVPEIIKKEVQQSQSQQFQTKTETLNTIPSKPMLQIKELDENPYSDRYKRNQVQTQTKNNSQHQVQSQKQYQNQNQNKKKQQKFTNNQNNVTSKKLISISQKNIEVLSILKNLDKKYDSESDFICQAIIEKHERDNETKNKNVDIKSLVKTALDELVGEKFIVLKGSSEVSVTHGYPYAERPNNAYIEQSSVNRAIEEKNEEENKDLLLGILGALEDDDDV